jgi:neural Wiskott-Aldrich syndrome protein
MATRGPHPATTLPGQLPQARLVLGAAAAAFGLFVAFHWIVMPGDHVSLDQKDRRSQSVTALDAATPARSGRNAPAAHTAGTRPAANGRAPNLKATRQAAKTTPRTAGKPVGSSPATKRPGVPAAGDPVAGGGDRGATETPPDQTSSSPTPPPSPPPPPPAGLPQVPQLPAVPQVPVPTVPDLSKPQVPSVPTPPVPTIP